MDRAAGWYKRYTQKILLLMGLGIAVFFNADVVDLYDRLSNDPEMLQQLADAAEQYVSARDRAGPLTIDAQPQVQTPSSAALAGGQPAPLDTATMSPAQGSESAPAPGGGYQPTAPVPVSYLYTGEDVGDQDFRTSLESLKSLLNNEIAEIKRPLGLGWEGVSIRELGRYDLASKVVGFILTALAISMGAPFWFDLLKKLVNIRSSGSRPYEN
jgi:hypothetical protein